MTQTERAPAETPVGIDWAAVHRRLETIRVALEEGVTPSPERKKAVLRARAKAMTQEPAQPRDEASELEVVEFRLAHESYGLESRFVREVYPRKEFAPIPCTPSFVLGIVNVRGQLFSVVDLRKFFDLPIKGLTDLNQVIILQTDTMEFGVLADAILGVRQISRGNLQSSLPTLTGLRAEFLLGVTPERTVILDAAKLLASQDLIVHEDVEA